LINPEDDFANMSPLEDASDHESRKGLSTHTLDFPNQGMLPAVMQGKGSEFHSPIVDLHVEVSPPVGDPSLQRATSPVVSITPFTTPMDGHHMSAIMTVPSPSLVLQNHFFSLEGLETTDVRGDPYIGTFTAIVEFNLIMTISLLKIILVQIFGLILMRRRRMIVILGRR